MENERNEIMNNENEKNILILCMSTLGGFKTNYYSNEIICQNLIKNIEKACEMKATKLQASLEDELEKEPEKEQEEEPEKESEKKPCVFRGISQLEPGTKYIMAKLCKQGRYLNKIYIIASDDARKKDKKIIDRKINVGGNFFKTKAGEEIYISNLFTEEFEGKIGNEFSAVDFYKLRIEQFINGKEPKGLKEDIENNGVYFDDKLSDFYSKKIVTEGFFEVKDLEGNIFDVISDLCKNIREDSNDNVNLFVDMQGGSRIDLSNLNVAIKMLEMDSDKLKLEQAVAVGFNPDGKRSISPMVDATINFWMLDMEAGMKEFIKTGRGDTLREFWEKLPVRYEREEDIINSIVAISDSIQWCDPKGFDDGLEKLKDALNSYYKTDEKGPLFSTFVEDLKKDYVNNGLLNDNNNVLSKPEHNTINQIKWCMSKHLYQQALTLLEARMPDDIVDTKILYLDESFDMNEFITAYSIKIPDYCLKHGKVKNEHKNNVFIKYFFNTNKDKSYKIPKIKEFMASFEENQAGKDISKLLKLYTGLSGKRNYSNHADKRGNNNRDEIIGQLTEFIEIYNNNICEKYSINFEEEFNKFKSKIEDFQHKKDNALEQMKKICDEKEAGNERYKIFGAGKNKDYIELNDILNILWLKEGQGIDFDEYCKRRFSDKDGKSAVERLKNRLGNLHNA